jgi:hypothetical protein
MAVLDLATGQKIKDAPTAIEQPTNDPLIELRGLLDRQSQGEQGLDQQIASVRQRISAPPIEVEPETAVQAVGKAVEPAARFLLDPAARQEALTTIGTGAVAQPVAGIAGLATAPFAGAEAGAEVVEEFQGALTIDPRTEAGQKALQGFGQLATPITKVLQATETALGDAGFDLFGPIGGALAQAIPTVILEAVGFKGTAALARGAVKQAGRTKVAKQAGLDVEDVSTIERTIEGAAESTKGLEKATGVETGLFPAQKTQLPSELIDQRLLTQLDASSRQAVKALEKQNKQVFQATNELVNKIGGEAATEAGAARFRTASQKALDAGKQRRSQQVKPLFDQAIKEGATVNLKPVRSIIDEALKDAPPGGDLSKTMKRIQNLIRSPVKGGAPSLRQLQKAKFQLDDMIEKFGDGALGNSVKREVVQIKQALVAQMENASPLFKEAQKRFQELSPAVGELQDSILGQVSKIDDVNIKNISQKIFDPKGAATDPTAIRKAKQIIDNVDPGAWDDLLRVELNRRVSAMVETIGDADLATKNIPGQLKRAIFGNPKQRQALLAGMSKEQKKNFVFLEDVLKRAESGRQAGSPTELFKQSTERLKGISGKLRDKLFNPIKSIQETGESALFDRNARKFAEIMFDPKFEPRLSKLRKLDPNSARAGTELEKLFKDAKVAGAGLPLVETENNNE